MKPELLDRALVAIAVLLAGIAAVVIARGVSPPELAPPEPIADRSSPAPKRLPALRPLPAGPRGPRPELAARPDGLVVWDVLQGQGEPLAEGQIAVVEYTGFLPDGTVFDSTYERAGATRIKLGAKKVPASFDLGLLGLREGGVRQLVVPPALAFGPRGLPGRIPPRSTVTYDFELLEVLTLPEAPTPVPAERLVERAGIGVHDLVLGGGAPLEEEQTAVVDYVVWAPDGRIVDTSYDRQAPFAFRYGQGAVAWEGGLAGMAVGGRRQLVVPPERAFGSEGRPPLVPPNATVVLEVELRGLE